MNRSEFFLLFKNLIFVLLVPGTVAGYIPIVVLLHPDFTADWIAAAGCLISLPVWD